eukprot:1046673-Pyramimonas_sp.AAC.1
MLVGLFARSSCLRQSSPWVKNIIIVASVIAAPTSLATIIWAIYILVVFPSAVPLSVPPPAHRTAPCPPRGSPWTVPR